MITRQEVKNIAWLLAVVAPLFVALVVVWLHSPGYQQGREQELANVKYYIMYNTTSAKERQQLMTRYHLTEEDVNIEKTFGAEK